MTDEEAVSGASHLYSIVDEDALAGEVVALGELVIHAGALLVSDPCYEGVDARVQLQLQGALAGPWLAVARRVEHASRTWTSFVVVHHVEHPVGLADERWELAPGIGVGVDSAQLGVFELARFRDASLAPPGSDEDGWYAMCCAAAERGGDVIPHGVVVPSGMGDGLYNCLVTRFEGRIVGVVVDFEMVGLDDAEG